MHLGSRSRRWGSCLGCPSGLVLRRSRLGGCRGAVGLRQPSVVNALLGQASERKANKARLIILLHLTYFIFDSQGNFASTLLILNPYILGVYAVAGWVGITLGRFRRKRWAKVVPK